MFNKCPTDLLLRELGNSLYLLVIVDPMRGHLSLVNRFDSLKLSFTPISCRTRV
jgi:hypothetical protein